MSNRFTGFLDSYDLFGKAIPGVAWFFGILLISPIGIDEISPGENAQIRGIAAILVIAILVGLIFGQGVDILARVFEDTVSWIKQQMRGSAKVLRVILGKIRIRIVSEISPDCGDVLQRHDLGVFSCVCGLGITGFILGLLSVVWTISSLYILAVVVSSIGGVWLALKYIVPPKNIKKINLLEDFDKIAPSNRITRIKRWVSNLLIDFNTTVTAHRSLYTAYLEGKAEAYVYPTDPNDFVYSRFESVIEPYLDVELEEFGESNKYDYTELYPFITAHLRDGNYSRAKGFQARYSFCRSMWLTTTVFSLLLFGMFFQISDPESLSTVMGASPPQWVETVIYTLLILLSVLLFGWLIEVILRIIGFHSDTVTWLFAISYGIGLSIIEWFSDSLVGSITGGLWNLILNLLSIFRSGTETIAFYLGRLAGYEDFTTILAYELLNDGILGLALILAISAFAFFDATGTYKRTYIEYLFAEIWISLTAENMLESSDGDPEKKGDDGGSGTKGDGNDGGSGEDADDTDEETGDDGNVTSSGTPDGSETEDTPSPKEELQEASDSPRNPQN